MIKIAAVYYVVVNVITFVLFGVDKAKAKSNAWRIPEKTLLGFSFFGGSFMGFLGMRLFHHKTKKPAFYISVPIFMILHIALWVYFIFYVVS